MKVKEIIETVQGRLLSGNPRADIELSKVSSDSRTIAKGQFFIALKGANFDGNRFVEEAFKKGAIGAIMSSPQARPFPSGKIIIIVKDTTEALQDIAMRHRMKFDIPVVAVTGSNGKTMVKEMASAVLSKRYDVLKNAGTENNHIGVPATLLRLKEHHQVCVLEIGANHKGEIGRLSEIAGPSVAVITNIGPSHLGFFGSLDGVYKAKTEILGPLGRKNGLLIINGDDGYLSGIRQRDYRVIRYGLGKANNLYAEALSSGRASVTFVVNGTMVFGLNLCGMHNVYNALAAIALGRHFGISYRSIRDALYACNPVKMRLDICRIGGIDIINDAYNSNPLSMEAALDAVKNYPARARWVVSADMLELGKESARFHQEVGKMVARSKVDGLLTFGDLSRYTLSHAIASGMSKRRSWHCDGHDEIARILKKVARQGDAVLLKGSRSMRMEKVLDKLRAKS
jgi:UDP-N-acetylmuramoyl-tripeptide--D-alanyl-D-alanine ligase